MKKTLFALVVLAFAGATFVLANDDLSNCVKYFDGCDTCLMVDGEVTTCTDLSCREEEMLAPKCVEYAGQEQINSHARYCQEKGGENKDTMAGNYPLHLCLFEDTRSMCEQEAFFNRECLKEGVDVPLYAKFMDYVVFTQFKLAMDYIPFEKRVLLLDGMIATLRDEKNQLIGPIQDKYEALLYMLQDYKLGLLVDLAE